MQTADNKDSQAKDFQIVTLILQDFARMNLVPNANEADFQAKQQSNISSRFASSTQECSTVPTGS
jgi:hypothetical protein